MGEKGEEGAEDERRRVGINTSYPPQQDLIPGRIDNFHGGEVNGLGLVRFHFEHAAVCVLAVSTHTHFKHAQLVTPEALTADYYEGEEQHSRQVADV